MKYVLEYDPTPTYKRNARLFLLALALVLDMVAIITTISALVVEIYMNLAYAAVLFLLDGILRIIANRLVFKYVYTYDGVYFKIDKVYPMRRKNIFLSTEKLVNSDHVTDNNGNDIPLKIDDYMRSRII